MECAKKISFGAIWIFLLFEMVITVSLEFLNME